MINVIDVLLLALVSGFVGSLIGLGGAAIITPILVLLGVDIKFAIAASMVAIIATSSGSASSYVRDRLSNVTAAFYLEIFTATGAIIGATITSFIAPTFLYFFFAGFLLTSFFFLRRKHPTGEKPAVQDRLAKWLRLEGSYALASAGMVVAGLAAGMLGIGGGAFKVSIHEVVLGMPSKVSTATSNFIIGMTALAGASVYFTTGLLYISLAAPLAIGTTVGAMVGSRVLPNLRNETVRTLFFAVLAVLIVEMLYKGVLAL